MNDIAYVVLSDLHFGAANSVLSALDAGATDQIRAVNTDTVSPVLSAFLDALQTVGDLNEGARPILVLAGDVLDLALSTDDTAAMVFQQFARAAFGGNRPLFADKVLYLPGNHDHHLWETAREGQYVAYLSQLPSPESKIEPAWHTTRMRSENDVPPVESSIVATLISRQAGRPIDVQVVYPNLALSNADTTRCVVVHHGHFTESIYLLMSRLKDLLFPEQRSGALEHVWDWEAENFAWIDFFWSTLGRSGGVGEDVGLVYAQLASPDCLRHYVGNLVQGIVDHEKAPHWLKHAETHLVADLVASLVGTMSGLERGSTGDVLTPASEQGLRDYLHGPVNDQLRTEFNDVVADQVSFIYGHTHKPFERQYNIDNYPNPVNVFNTGGWVVDATDPVPVHGAAAVLVSAALDVVSLRIYDQTVDGTPSPVRLNGSGDWYEELGANLTFDQDPWLRLSRVAAESVADRNQLASAFQRNVPTR